MRSLLLRRISVAAGIGSLLAVGGLSYAAAETECGVATTSRIIAYMASQSAQGADLERLTRWSAQLSGRGACRRPDGAGGLLRSALVVFADEFAAHQHARCLRARPRKAA